MKRWGTTFLLSTACVLAAGCAAPFGVRHASPEAVHRSLTANVLTTGELSNSSQIILRRENLVEAFDDDPETTLRTLRTRLQAGALANDDLFTLAELSFHHAERGGGKPHYLAAAVYAYAYLFPDDAALTPDSFDPRLREAVDVYNRALTETFESADGYVTIAAGTYALPFGSIDVAFDTQQLQWGDRQLERFSPAAELEVVGFRNRYRQAGIGAPLAAATRRTDPDEAVRAFTVGPHVRVPVTALLRLSQPREQVLATHLTATLELHPSTETQTVEIDQRVIPLEQEPTAALGLGLSEAQPWAADLGRFLGQVLPTDRGASALGGREPHRLGRIPVVFVHGTVSNFSVWANMVNDLDSDPIIRKHFEFWFFRYDSGQPILYSGWQLRSALSEAVRDFQSGAPDPCLDEMVVIGHSQGGLLTKLTAIESGDTFWSGISDKPFADTEFSAESRKLLEQVLFVHPLPFVRRVVFIATPQHGSYLAGPQLVRALAQRLITLPVTMLSLSADLLGNPVIRQAGFTRLPTSIDNMSPGTRFIRAISTIPVVPGIAAHSICGAQGEGPLEQRGDGVVKYTSAHIDGVESELVVPYEHSMQAKAEVVAEVQRILHRHLTLTSCADHPPDVQTPQ
jgi:pimeloyl-ACP methyl ester carboxylesterase